MVNDINLTLNTKEANTLPVFVKKQRNGNELSFSLLLRNDLNF